MDTIQDLENKLKQAKQQQAKIQNAKFPTGIVIDLRAPEGNALAILGICKGLFRQLDMMEEYKAFYEKFLKNDYKNALALAPDWFGFIYINK